MLKSWRLSGQTPCSSRSTKIRMPRTLSGQILKIFRRETPQLSGQTYASAPSATQCRSSSSYLDRTTCGSVCAHCFFAPLQRITESLRLQKTLKVIKSNHLSNTTGPPLNHVPNHHTHTFLKYFQVWWLYHLPVQSVPMSDHPFHEKNCSWYPI